VGEPLSDPSLTTVLQHKVRSVGWALFHCLGTYWHLPSIWYTRSIVASKTKRVLGLAANQQIVRSKDASALGVPRNYLSRLVQKGLLKKVGRGLYSSTSSPATEHLSLIEATYKVPKGVLCLLSALQFHKFTTQAPHQVWMAIDVKAWAPRVASPAVRFVRMSGPALHFDAKEHAIRGGTLKVYTAAKTVADCFKFRNKIGMDTALEAFRECRRLKKASMDELWAAAKVCRVANVMRPYLESP
jgi:predicted transcriptional regulator of viral defense system